MYRYLLMLMTYSFTIFSVDLNPLISRNCRQKTCRLITLETKAKFSYDSRKCDGPDKWRDMATCWIPCDNGNNYRQSPINIGLNDARYIPYPALDFRGTLCGRIRGVLRNTGQSPVFEAQSASSIVLRGVPRSSWFDSFVFKEMHVHVGSNAQRGSEHSIGGRFYPMEVHLVFWKRRYVSYDIAKTVPGGLAVIAVFIQVAGNPEDTASTEEIIEFKETNSSYSGETLKCHCTNDDEECKEKCTCNYDYDCDGNRICRTDDSNRPRKFCAEPTTCVVRFADELNYLMQKYYPRVTTFSLTNMVTIDEGISPGYAMPLDQHYYSYSGSLTAPPCLETVQWMVMRCPIRVSLNALLSLQGVQNSYGNRLGRSGTRRPVQRGRFGQRNVRVIRNFRRMQYENFDVC